MRFKIEMNRTGRQRMLPMDYQYYISACIYKVIGQADPAFANFLHSQGYADGNKQFKLFAYSPLKFGKPILWKERALFELATDRVELHVGFYLPEAAERFIVGLFNQQEVYVGDRFNGIELAVSQIERLPEPVPTATMRYRATSPVVVSTRTDDSKYARYLSPTDAGYAQMLKNNLLQRWASIPGATPLPADIDLEWQLMGEPKSKLVTIKPGTPNQSKVRGYVYPFALTAPKALHSLIRSSGLGEKCSTGFGWVEAT